jgi:hypothetical protein
MTLGYAVMTAHDWWKIALLIALIATAAVAVMLVVLVRTVDAIDKSVAKLLGVAVRVAGNTAYIPQLQATAPVLGEIIGEALVQDDYMNALTDGFGADR